MLYKTLLRMIERGNTEGIAEKIDIFYAAAKLTDEEYMSLVNELTAANDQTESEVTTE